MEIMGRSSSWDEVSDVSGEDSAGDSASEEFSVATEEAELSSAGAVLQPTRVNRSTAARNSDNSFFMKFLLYSFSLIIARLFPTVKYQSRSARERVAVL
jgi:hypothetical protein